MSRLIQRCLWSSVGWKTRRFGRREGAPLAPARSSCLSAFTLLELLVVIAIIGILAALMLPGLTRAKSLAAERVCSSNYRQIYLALSIYAGDYRERFPVEPTEHNPHPGLLSLLDAQRAGLVSSFYCAQAPFLEPIARNPAYTPAGGVDTVLNTPENRRLGNVTYIYWSFESNKYCAEATGPVNSRYWRNPQNFFPRRLTTAGVEWLNPEKAAPEAPPSGRWVLSDFFRQGAPFPHSRGHASGLNVLLLDGHTELIFGSPKTVYR